MLGISPKSVNYFWGHMKGAKFSFQIFDFGGMNQHKMHCVSVWIRFRPRPDKSILNLCFLLQGGRGTRHIVIPGFEAIVEQRIQNAQKNGELDNLPGKGKPLVFEDDQGPEELRLAHKILKNAGFLPPEVELRKRIGSAEALLMAAEYDSPEKRRIQKKLNYLLTKLRTMGSDSCTTGFLELYRNQIMDRML